MGGLALSPRVGLEAVNYARRGGFAGEIQQVLVHRHLLRRWVHDRGGVTVGSTKEIPPTSATLTEN